LLVGRDFFFFEADGCPLWLRLPSPFPLLSPEFPSIVIEDPFFPFLQRALLLFSCFFYFSSIQPGGRLMHGLPLFEQADGTVFFSMGHDGLFFFVSFEMEPCCPLTSITFWAWRLPGRSVFFSSIHFAAEEFAFF